MVTDRGQNDPRGLSQGQPTPDAAGALLRGGLRPAVVAGALVTAVAAFSGGRSAAGAATGTALAIAALATGPLLLRRGRSWAPPALMALALAGYSGAVLLLGLAFALLAPASWLSSGALAAALVVVTIAWIAGQAWAVARLRVLAFGDAGEPGPGPSAPGVDHVPLS